MTEAATAPTLAHEHMVALDLIADELRDVRDLLNALAAHNGEAEFPIRGLFVVSNAVGRLVKELDAITGGGAGA